MEPTPPAPLEEPLRRPQRRAEDAGDAELLPPWLFPTLLATVLTGAVILRVWGLRMHLPMQLHPDEWRIVARAMAMGTGDLNPHTTEIGALMIYVCFFLFALYGGIGLVVGHFASVQDIGVAFCHDPSTFYLIARSVSVVSGVLAVYVLYLAGREIVGRWGGLVAAAFLTVHPEHVERSHIAYPDALMVLLMVCVFYVLARDHGRKLSYRTDVYCGILCGLATAAKYLGAFAFVVYGVWRLISVARDAGYKKAASHLVAGAASTAAGFFIGMPTFVPALSEKVGAFYSYGGVVGAMTGQTPWDWSPARILGRTWANVFTGRGMGPVGASLALVGILAGLRRRTALSAALLICVALNVLWVARLGRFAPRWIFPATISLCLATALAIPILRHLAEKLRWERRAAWAALALMPLSLWPSVRHSMDYLDWITGPDTRVLATQWIEQNIPPGTPILLDGATSVNPQLRANRASIERMLDAAEGVENPTYANIGTYHKFQIAALERYDGPTYDVYRRSHIWFQPAAEEGAEVYERRESIPVVPGRDLGVPFSEYISRGVEYFVVSQISLDRYDNERYPVDQKFYEDLFRETHEVARFPSTENVSGHGIIVLRRNPADETTGAPEL